VPQVTTEGWPDDRLTSSDAPSVVRHHAGPADDPDRYELLGEAEGADEAWHVIDHRAATGEALFTLAALRPADDLQVRPDGDLQVRHDAEPTGERAGERGEATPPEALWRERAAGLARVRHARLAGLVSTFTGPAPHVPGRADPRAPAWHYAVLEQAAGRSVADWLRDDPGAGVEERFTVLATAAGVLQELHRGSEDAPPVVHGDITPRSVRLGGFWPADGVRLSGASLGGLRRGPVRRRDSGVYTAPEVRAGALPSAASDVFGFGATAVLVLTGSPPATSPDGVLDPALVKRQLAAAPLTAPHPGLAELLLQALSPDPALRPDRLPAWVNGMRAFVEPRPAPGTWGGTVPASPAAALAPARPARSLPARPVVAVVGALLLATAGTAVAITAVQQGRLKDVPNPVAIVQPQPTSAPPPPPASSAPAPAATGSPRETSRGPVAPTRRPSASASSAQGAPSPTGADLPGPTATSAPPVLPPPVVPTAAPTAPPASTPPAPVVTPPAPTSTPPVSTPPTSTPPVVTPPVSTPPTTTPPTSTPPVSTPPTSTPPVSTPPPGTPPAGPSGGGTPPVTTPASTPGTPTATRSAPEVTLPARVPPTLVGDPARR
jgi:hypothetical protein